MLVLCQLDATNDFHNSRLLLVVCTCYADTFVVNIIKLSLAQNFTYLTYRSIRLL